MYCSQVGTEGFSCVHTKTSEQEPRQHRGTVCTTATVCRSFSMQCCLLWFRSCSNLKTFCVRMSVSLSLLVCCTANWWWHVCFSYESNSRSSKGSVFSVVCILYMHTICKSREEVQIQNFWAYPCRMQGLFWF